VLDGRAEIAGVMPASFQHPLVPAVDVWLRATRPAARFPFSGDLAAVRDQIAVRDWTSRQSPRDTAQRESGRDGRARRPLSGTNAGLGVNVALHEEIVGDVRGLVLPLQLVVA
jgi:hypothetical protein